MHGVAELLGAAAVAYLASRRFGLPAIPLLILAGAVLALVAPPPAEIRDAGLVLGVSFLLFLAGMELDSRRLRHHGRAVLRVGLVQFVVLAVLGWGLATLMGLSAVEAGYVALALPASSTLVGVRLLRQRQQVFESVGRLVLGVLLLQDVLVLLTIPLVTEFSQGTAAVALKTLQVAGLTAVAWALRRWLAPVFLRWVDESELLLLGSLTVLFVLLGACRLLDLPVVVGAFLAGVAFSRFPVHGVLRAELAPLGDFFTAIFFTSLGALVRVPTVDELVMAGVFVAVVVGLTPPLVRWMAERAGLTSRSALEAGLLLSQTSEISLVVGLAGMLQGDISESLFVVIAMVTTVTMLLTPFLSTEDATEAFMTLFTGPPADTGTPPTDHVLLLGAGSTGMPLLEDLILSGCRVVVLDDDPAVVRQVREAGVEAILGEAWDPEVLRAAGVDEARVVVSTIRRPRDNAAALALATGSVVVRVFESDDADWVQARGGEPILYSEAAAEALVDWWDGAREALARERRQRVAQGQGEA